MLLAGGVGGARMARGFAAVSAPGDFAVIVNVGDDQEMYGVLVCADLDTVTYTLADLDGPQGWGIAGDTGIVMGHLAAHGVDTRFHLGDRDLAHCLARTAALADGVALSKFTAEAISRLGIPHAVLPASDDPVRTKVETAAGELLDFQDYFVLRGHTDQVAGLRYDGADRARPAPGTVAALAAADVVVVAPSNPPLSIWPILAVREIDEAVRARPMVVGVSPLIGGRAVKGPLVEVMRGLSLPATNAGIVSAYGGLLSHLVIDGADVADKHELEALDVKVIVADTLIQKAEAAAALARLILEAAR